MSGDGARSWRRWLAEVRHPAGWIGLVALAGFVLPLLVAGTLILAGHHLNGTAAGIVVTVCLGWPVAWLALPGYLEARKASLRDDGRTQPGSISIGPGSVVGFGGVTAGQVVVQQMAIEGPPMRLAPRPVLLAGREEMLVGLHMRLAGGESPGPRTVVLCGLAGAGKTSVAVEYAHQHLREVGVIWQLAAENRALLAAGFGELAAQLGAQDLLGARDPVASVHRVLARFPEGWLLIFDNAQDWASVERFLPPAGPGRVLITSRNTAWPPGQVLEVPVLSTKVAADFLISRTNDPDSQAAAELAAELGGLPLALEQAGAYMVAAMVSLAGYLLAVRQRRVELLARGEPAGYPGTVAATLGLVLPRLEQTVPGALGLLRLLAFCAPEEPIPLQLLLQSRQSFTRRLRRPVKRVLKPLLEDELAAWDAVAALRRYSLISPAGGGAVLLHRLVQHITADQMPAELARAWRRAATAVIEAAVPGDPQQSDSWPVFAALLPHVQVALAADSDGRGLLADYLYYRGSYAAGLELWREVLDARERSLGPKHPATLSARANLAALTGAAGDAAGARDQYAALLPISERVMGAEHPDTLSIRANLASWTGAAGDAAGARDLCAALLPIRERAIGAEHPHTLTTRANLAQWTGAAGDAAGARDHYAALLPIRERAIGAEHPHTLSTRANLARWTGEAGDAAGARDQYAALLPTYERVMGAEHPDTLIIRSGRARWTGAAGDAAGARDQYAALLPTFEQVLGPAHPETLITRNNLASWTGRAGDAAGARDQCAALLPIRERVIGAEHPDTLTTRNNLAVLTGEAGDAAGARDQCAALLPTRERVIGAEHPDTLTTRVNLAQWTGAAGNAAGARDQYAAVLPTFEQVMGAEHPETRATRANLAFWTEKARTGDAAGLD